MFVVFMLVTLGVLYATGNLVRSPIATNNGPPGFNAQVARSEADEMWADKEIADHDAVYAYYDIAARICVNSDDIVDYYYNAQQNPIARSLTMRIARAGCPSVVAEAATQSGYDLGSIHDQLGFSFNP